MWGEFCGLIEPHCPKSGNGGSPVRLVEKILRMRSVSMPLTTVRYMVHTDASRNNRCVGFECFAYGLQRGDRSDLPASAHRRGQRLVTVVGSPGRSSPLPGCRAPSELDAAYGAVSWFNLLYIKINIIKLDEH